MRLALFCLAAAAARVTSDAQEIDSARLRACLHELDAGDGHARRLSKSSTKTQPARPARCRRTSSRERTLNGIASSASVTAAGAAAG